MGLQFLDRNLTMKSMLKEPIPNVDYLKSYGAFLYTAALQPWVCLLKKDSHPLHGELPNAEYEKAWLQIGEDENGKYISVGGQYHHCIAFNTNYVAIPNIRVYENSSLIDVSILN